MGRTVKRSNGLVGAKGTKDSAPMITNGAASPMARLTARMIPVRIPGIACGNTRRQITCHRVPPNANPPSRIDDGTALIASWEDTITTGMISNASVSPAAVTFFPSFPGATSTKKATNIDSPRMPYTMDGTAARFWMFVWISSATRLLPAYSSR